MNIFFLLLGFCSSFPILVFSLPGGVLADRVNRVLLFSLGRGTGALLTLLLRPWPPFQWLPGWCVGVLLLWAIGELVGWLWWPQRSA